MLRIMELSFQARGHQRNGVQNEDQKWTAHAEILAK